MSGTAHRPSQQLAFLTSPSLLPFCHTLFNENNFWEGRRCRHTGNLLPCRYNWFFCKGERYSRCQAVVSLPAFSHLQRCNDESPLHRITGHSRLPDDFAAGGIGRWAGRRDASKIHTQHQRRDGQEQ